MTKGMITKAQVFYRYLFSYFVILLIPLGLLGYYGSLQLKQTVNHYVEKMNQEMLSQLGEGVDTKIIEMNKIAARIETNPDLTPYAVTKDFYGAYQAKTLLDYRVSNDFIHEVLFYVRGEPLLYSSVSTYRIPTFINDIYHYRFWTEAQFREEMDTLTKPMLRPAEDVNFMGASNERFISYALPIPLGSLHPYGTVLFLIKESSLLLYLKADEYPRTGNTVIMDERNRIVTSYKGDSHVKDEDLYPLLVSANGMFSVEKLDKVNYFVSRMKSEQTGWTYVNIMPVSDVMKPIDIVVSQWMRTLFIILIIGSVAIYFALRYNYHPIKKLAQLAESHLGKSLMIMNELEAVRTLIDRTMRSNRELGEKWENNRSAIVDHMLLSLLKGEVETREQLDERCKEVGFEFGHAAYCVFVVEGAGANPDTKQLLAESVADCSSSGMTVYYKESIDNNRITFLVSTDHTPQQLSVWLQEWHNAVYRDLGIKLTCGVGQLYEELKQIGRSFIEASTAIDYKLIKGMGQIISFRDLTSDHFSTLYDANYNLENLSYWLREGQTRQIVDALTHFVHQIKQGGTTLFVVRCLCFDIIHTVMKTLNEMKSEFPGITEKLPDVLTLMEFHTVEELVELVSKACIDVCHAMEQHHRDPAERHIYAMTDYMQQRYDYSGFSVQMMADHFSLSASYVSRLFKEHTGQTITDYMNLIRINNAKRLLRESNASIKDIVQQVGYFDTSSFIRKFKAEVGVTPGEYRKMLRKQESGSGTG
ncbi:helix-turn-helix domain-containing protein [Bacillus sp. 3255]|uniref:helix-turn-helix domain-containing protein n=1 Tax=Bacillus sp. 3255 TaxID=2817904 RepID=UPI00285EBB06|nr:helix-turn-helix domain-containing protein [Bacillus sp. 3255]MDR6885233.1 AraC-like DNA-binding protein [Bacillus sp. 3255]